MKPAISILLAGAACALAMPGTPARASSSFLVSPLSFDFGDVAVGGSGIQQSVTITNVTSATEALSLAGGGAGEFGGVTSCGMSLAAGASCDIFYDFTPSTLGSQTGSTSLTVDGQTYSFAFKGNGLTPFLVTPRTMDFGSVALGAASSSQQVVIKNVSNATQTLNLAGGGAGQFGGVTSCSGSLAPGASCAIDYAFTPTATGATTGTTSLSVNGDYVGFSFSGSGGLDDASPFLVSARSFDFGNVPVGEASASQSVTIANVSGVTQALNLAGGAAGLFGGVTDCGGSLAPGGSCSVDYSFTPTALGATTGSTSLSIDGTNYAFDFSGAGISPFLLSALSFDFGEVNVGATSAGQRVLLYNVSDITRTFSLAGGAAGLFGGVTDCGGPLAPDASCYIEYAFSPTAAGALTGTTTLDVDGIPTTFTFKGVGIGAAVPEPASWAMMIGGIGLAGGVARRRYRTSEKAFTAKVRAIALRA